MDTELIFKNFSQAPTVLAELRTQKRNAYRTVMDTLALRRKLRPAFLEKKSGPERHLWMASELAKHSNADLAIEVLFAWLMECHSAMIVSFLDSLEIPHNGSGIVETLPPEPSEEKVNAAIEALLVANPAWVVAIYLRLFSQMDIANWPHLRNLVVSDTRLQPENFLS